jgi:hypothetical protein
LCGAHAIDPFAYLDEFLRVLPHWPHDRYLELAPPNWLATRARLDPDQLALLAPTRWFDAPRLDQARAVFGDDDGVWVNDGIGEDPADENLLDIAEVERFAGWTVDGETAPWIAADDKV